MTESTPTKILLDCDPGHDDAVAIMLALGNPSIDLIGVSTVAGNQTLEKVTRNAQSVLKMCQREDVRVHPGADRPLVREIEIAEDIHGDSGLDGVELPTPSVPPHEKGGVQFIIDEVMGAEPGTITVVATGPLTNVALAARLEPRIIPRVKEVVLMGGGYHEGNWTAVAEFNIWVDPEAAKIVFDARWPLAADDGRFGPDTSSLGDRGCRDPGTGDRNRLVRLLRRTHAVLPWNLFAHDGIQRSPGARRMHHRLPHRPHHCEHPQSSHCRGDPR